MSTILKTILSKLSENDKQDLEKNGIPPVCGIPLLFVSAASPQYWPNALNLVGAYAVEGQAVVTFLLATGYLNYNSTWQLTPEGYIVYVYAPQFVLGILNGSICIVTRTDDDASQQWTFKKYGNGYTITNKSYQTVLTVTDPISTGSPSGQLSLEALNGNPPGTQQLWKPLPSETFTEKRVYIQTEMAGKPGTGTIPWVVTGNATSVNTAQWVPGNADQVWIMKPNGTIESASDKSNILISNSKSSTDNTPVTLAAADTAISQAYYTWTFANNFLSVNPGGDIGEIGLNVDDNNLSNPLITYKDSGGSNCKWYIFPEQSTVINSWIYMAITSGSGVTGVLTIDTTNGAVGASLQLMQIQHGNPAQLWQITQEGYLMSALSPNLVLSIDTNNNNALITQTKEASGCLQTWCYCPNGAFVTCFNSDTLIYLSESSFPDGNTPGGVSTATKQGDPVGDNVVWDIIDYQPEVTGQWFTIYSGLSTPKENVTYLLTMDNNWNTLHLNPPLGDNILREGTPSFSQLWQLTLDGYIINAANPYLALTYNPNTSNAVMEPMQAGNINQQWYWGDKVDTTYSFNYKNNKKKLNVPGGILLNGASGSSNSLALYSVDIGYYGSEAVSIQAPNSTAGTPNQLWYFMPYSTNYDQPTNIRNLGGTDKVAGLFITLLENDDNSYSLTVGQTGSDPSLTTWKFVYPGYIMSIANSDIVLSLKLSGSVGALIYGPEVIAGLRQPYPEAWQLWTATNDGLLINNETGWALCANTAAEGTTLSTSGIGKSDSHNPEIDLQLWEFGAGKALQTLLVQPPLAYPALPAGPNEQSYYTQISNYLGLPLGLRSQYMNLSAPLSSYQTGMNAYIMEQTPGAVPAGDWLTILRQLNKELTAVIAVQQFFLQAGAFHQALNLAQSMMLSEMITACKLSSSSIVNPQKKSKSWIWDLCEGIIYTSLNIAGSSFGDPELGKQASDLNKLAKNGFPIMANLTSTTFNSGQAGLGARSQRNKDSAILQAIYSYEMSVLQLQESLLTVFEASGNALAQIETLVLSDWGKISAVYEMTKMVGGADSLYWTPNLSPIMAKSLLSSYASRVLQILIPAIKGVYISGSPFSGYPIRNKNALKLNTEGNGMSAENVDQSSSSWVTVNISEQVLNLLWSNGTKPLDFFRQTHGWDCIPMQYPNLIYSDNDGKPTEGAVVVTIQNCTTQAFTVGLVIVNRSGNLEALAGNLNVSRKLKPFGLAQFAAYSYTTYNSGNFGASGIFTINNGSGTTVITGTLSNNAVNGIGGLPEYSISLKPSSTYKTEYVRTNPNGQWLFNIYIYNTL